MSKAGRHRGWQSRSTVRALTCTRFSNASGLTKLLLEISEALDYNFFECYAKHFEERKSESEKITT